MVGEQKSVSFSWTVATLARRLMDSSGESTLQEAVLKALLAEVVGYLKSLMTSDGTVEANAQSIVGAVEHHVSFVDGWSSTVSFADLRTSKHTVDVFVPLDILVYPRRLRVSSDEEVPTAPLFQVVEAATTHIVLTGHPGAGKTTSLKRIARRLIDDDDFLPRCRFPLVVPFRQLNALIPRAAQEDDNLYYDRATADAANRKNSGVLISHLFDALGLGSKGRAAADVSRRERERAVCGLIALLSPLVLLDGFDELGPSLKQDVFEDVSMLMSVLAPGAVILTARTGITYSVDGSTQYELAPLSRVQIEQFADRWLGREQAAQFLSAVHRSPFADTAIRPLMLAHLCAVFERIKALPEKPKTVYRKVISLLLSEWDEQRGILRRTRYAALGLDQQFDFLCRLAYLLTTECRGASFTEAQLRAVYRKLCAVFTLRPEEFAEVFRELEEHTGVLVRSGYESFEFVHKSIQEHLTAEHLVRLASIPKPGVIRELASECAVAVAISSDSAEYLAELCLRRVVFMTDVEGFVGQFVARLALERPELVGGDELVLALTYLYSLALVELASPDHESGDLAESENALWLHAQLRGPLAISGLTPVERYYDWAGARNRGDLVVYRRKGNQASSSVVFPDWAQRLPPLLFIPRTCLGS